MTCDEVNDVCDSERTILLAEYQAAQASAQHHDSTIWSVTSIVWGASLVLLGIAIRSAESPALRIFVAGLSLIAIFLHILVWGIQSQLRDLKISKYNRCRAIETRLKYMSQHSAVAHDEGSQTAWYGVTQGVFIGAWLILGGVMLCLRAS